MATFESLRKKYGQKNNPGQTKSRGYVYKHSQSKSLIRLITEPKLIICHTVLRNTKAMDGHPYEAYSKKLCKAHGANGIELEDVTCSKCSEEKGQAINFVMLIDRVSGSIQAGLLPYKFVDALEELEHKVKGSLTDLDTGWELSISTSKDESGYPEYRIRALKQSKVILKDFADIHYPTFDEIFDVYRPKRLPPLVAPSWFKIDNPFKEGLKGLKTKHKKAKKFDKHSK